MISRSKEWWMAHAAGETEVPIGAGTAPTDGCMVYKPTFGDKAARFFGYRHHHGQEPRDHETLTQGWARTETSLNFTFGDRLRLLFSGKLRISHTHYADTPINTMQNRVDLTFYAPWENDRG